MPTTKFCASCGNQVSESLLLCPKCGHRDFSATPASAQNSSLLESPPHRQQETYHGHHNEAGSTLRVDPTSTQGSTNSFLADLFSSIAGLGFLSLILIFNFPGGTIFMALMCKSWRLDGWDWVLSVIIPGYGMLKGIFFC